MSVRVLMIASPVSAPSLVMTCWRVPASSLSMRFQPIWRNFFVSTAASKREEFVLGLGIMYVHFRQIASVSVSSRSCGFVVLDELAVVVDVSWLNRQWVPRRQQPRLKSKQDPGLLCLEVSGCSHRKGRVSSTHGILEGVLGSSRLMDDLWMIE